MAHESVVVGLLDGDTPLLDVVVASGAGLDGRGNTISPRQILHVDASGKVQIPVRYSGKRRAMKSPDVGFSIYYDAKMLGQEFHQHQIRSVSVVGGPYKTYRAVALLMINSAFFRRPRSALA